MVPVGDILLILCLLIIWIIVGIIACCLLNHEIEEISFIECKIGTD